MNNMTTQASAIWESITEKLKAFLSAGPFQTFLSFATFQSYEANILTLQVPNEFAREWVKEKCETFIKGLPLPGLSEPLLIRYVFQEETLENSQLSIFDAPAPPPSAPQAESGSAFNQKYTFEQFIVGHNNRFAYAASEAVSKAPAKAYNPLFIYGSVGLGKTHLLHAIGSRILENNPSAKIGFVSSEKFTNGLINAIKDKTTQAFRDQYRLLDVLMVDDIQFLAGKEQTQEEFFHTFNDLHSANRQIVLASDRPPKDIPTLKDRLRTRFEWGLLADIQPPELETRIAILRKKIELNQLEVSDQILHFIATQIPTNVREMEGALNRIVAYASLLNTEITLSMAANVIKDMIGTKTERPLTINLIRRFVSDYFSISELELNSKSRTKEVAEARQIAMYLSRELTNMSLPKIGENFGNRDHTTVMHACDKIKSLISTDSEVRNVVQILITNIKKESQ